jgi:starch-binding outer membrane protein SusE/F
MKSLSKILLLSVAFVFAWGCSKVEDIVTINSNVSLSASLSASTLTLLKDNADKDALTVSWVKPDYGFDAAPTYTILVDKKGNNFAKPYVVSVGLDLKKVFKTSDFNTSIKGQLGVLPAVATDLEVKVEALLGAATKFTSTVMSLKATAYEDKFDPASAWGVVGDATPGGWNGPDLPMYRAAGVVNTLVAYVTLNDGQIKFRRNNDWAVNLGSSGAVEPDQAPAGSLAANGKNLGVKKGSYKITVDTTANKYKVEAFTWGIVGDATANGWGGPDQPMSYDATEDVWRAVITVVDGSIKIRQNNDWANNYGAATGADGDPIAASGALSAGGKNFGVKKGTYLITMDLKNAAAPKYTFVPFKPWGLVGDATPNGWNGPDVKFTYNFNTKKWVLENVVLTAAQVKFRENNDWANNFGAAGTVEPAPIGTGGGLVAGGKNFGVAAGTWSFELDLNDVANPKYKATKK